MLKKILLTLILLTGISAFAIDNTLNSVVISKEGDETSIVLRSDEVTKVKKEVEGNNKVILTLKGITQSRNLNTVYKNRSDVNGLVIQSENNNELKIYIDAPDISKANIVFETPNSAPITVTDGISEERVIWSVVSVVLLLAIMRYAKNVVVAEKPQKDINEIIKEREKALYRNFQKEVATLPSINYKLKGYRKHVLKGETIRSYESRMTKV